ncbi:MAG TPA: formate dehydrogenase subunit gamma [Rhodocyclaceae bacterium]
MAAAAEVRPEPAHTDGHNISPVWREVRRGVPGVTTVKGVESNVLIQTQGDVWRHLHNNWVVVYGGVLIILVLVAISVFHLAKGTMRLSAPPTGHKIQRFSLFERAIHGIVATCFVLLAIGGLLLMFGKHVLMPVFGHTAISVAMQILKPIHNFLGLVFAAALVVMILMWAKDNLWDKVDAEWIRRAGGLIDRTHVPAWRFNFGEKTWFWIGVTFLGLVVVVSGVLLDFPMILAARGPLTVADLVHGIGAMLMILLSFGHIYMGTIGLEGTSQSMTTGKVDEVWAKDHNLLWYRQVTGKTD